MQEVNLATVPLTTSSLPCFEIDLPQQTKSTDKNDFTFDSVTNFQFSYLTNPMDESEQNELNKTLSIESTTSNFSFASFPNFKWNDASQSLKPKDKESHSTNPINESEQNELNKTLSVESANSNLSSASFSKFICNGTLQSLKTKEKKNNEANKVKTGSDMNSLSQSPLNKEANVWENSECLIANNNDEEKFISCRSLISNVSDSLTATVQPNKNGNKCNLS